ncbi:hypothetical protein C8Q76DRAFT_753298, partial [Earliella scabrosa]
MLAQLKPDSATLPQPLFPTCYIDPTSVAAPGRTSSSTNQGSLGDPNCNRGAARTIVDMRERAAEHASLRMNRLAQKRTRGLLAEA